MKSAAWNVDDVLTARAQGWEMKIDWQTRMKHNSKCLTPVYSVHPVRMLDPIKDRATRGCDTCQKAVTILVRQELSGLTKINSELCGLAGAL